VRYFVAATRPRSGPARDCLPHRYLAGPSSTTVRERISTLYIRYYFFINCNTILYHCVGPQIRKVDGQAHRGTLVPLHSVCPGVHFPTQGQTILRGKVQRLLGGGGVGPFCLAQMGQPPAE
jgi:hypothetical protein